MDTHIVWKRYLPLNIQRIFQHTPVKKKTDPQPALYERTPFIFGFGHGWGMFRGVCWDSIGNTAKNYVGHL